MLREGSDSISFPIRFEHITADIQRMIVEITCLEYLAGDHFLKCSQSSSSLFSSDTLEGTFL